MSLKATITLILGLVFQLAQVLPGAVVTTPCPSHAESCECCRTARPCHCAANSDSGQKESPKPIDNGATLKVTAAKPVETKLSADQAAAIAPPATNPAAPHTGPLSGFTGVRLSVAFCTFVI